jgi:DHA2 family multidrug resistance protein-like MFS transporter
VYRGVLGRSLPDEVPSEAAVVAHDTLGAAVAIADQLPVELGAIVVETAREAFVQGMHLTSVIAAAVALGLTVLALVMLRHVPPIAEPGEVEEKTLSPEPEREPEPVA